MQKQNNRNKLHQIAAIWSLSFYMDIDSITPAQAKRQRTAPGYPQFTNIFRYTHKPAHEVQSNPSAPTPCRFHFPGPYDPTNQADLAATTPRVNTEYVWIPIVDSVNGGKIHPTFNEYSIFQL